jgi:hypothetical protein
VDGRRHAASGSKDSKDTKDFKDIKGKGDLETEGFLVLDVLGVLVVLA